MLSPTTILEKQLLDKGYDNVCGIDEVGRGPLAGPVVVGAVSISNLSQVVEGVKDSKVLSVNKRVELCEKIKNFSLGWGIGVVDNGSIDKKGLSIAINEAIILAIKDLESKMGNNASFMLMDGGMPSLDDYETMSIKKGDLLHYVISASSIIAKVTRDRMMLEYASEFPMYGFDKNVGYGTKFHLEALMKYGPCKIHRFSFKPISNFLDN